MDKYPIVSIVVPTYNRRDYLQECLDSIVNQNYPNLEIIITDDNSTDDTEKVCKNYVKKYSFIKYVKNKKYPQGPNGNKNNGLDYCTGELIAIFDDDDTMVENALKIMVDKLLEGYDVVMGNCRIISERNDNGEFSGKGLNKSGKLNWKDYLCGKISGEFFILFKKNILGNKRFETDLYGREGILWMAVLKNKKIYYIHKAVRNYRVHKNSVTHKVFERVDKILINYEREIEYYSQDMKKYCPCYLASLYKEAAYFAKLSSQYKKGFKDLIESIKLCPKYKNTYIMFIIMFFPKKTIPYLSKFRVFIKRKFKW